MSEHSAMSMDANPDDAGAEDFTPRFGADGLIPVIAQEAESGEVLLLAYMNAEALRRTLDEGLLVLWSRSRRALWRKGEQSGNTLRLVEMRVNCEGNSLLARVRLEGIAACHEGYRSCYYRRVRAEEDGEFVAEVVEPRLFDPATVYGPHALAHLPGQRALFPLERDALALYAAYERLRDEPAPLNSSTATLLHASDHEATANHALARAAEEVEELRGAVAGTHAHYGDERDVLLEASQVGYWTTIAAVALGAPYGAWEPHRCWLAGWNADTGELPQPADDRLRTATHLLLSAGMLCHQANIAPERVIAADLTEMRAKHGGEGKRTPS